MRPASSMVLAVVAGVGLMACSLSPRLQGAIGGGLVGAAVGALVGGDGGQGGRQPIPPGTPAGGGSRAEGALIGGVVGAAAGALIGGFFRRDRTPILDPERVLALIALAPADSMRIVAEELAASAGLRVLEVHALNLTSDGLIVFGGVDRRPVAEKEALLRRDPRVRLAQPDFWYLTLVQDTVAEAGPAYGRRLIKADRLSESVSGRGVTIALIDTGLDREHAELQGRVVEAIDLTGSGFTADIHGTMLAGIIVADPQNRVGIAGVAPAAAILAIKVCVPERADRARARCRTSALARGVDAAVAKHAQVLNLSIGGPRDALVERVVSAAVGRGRVLIAAAGNGGPRDRPPYPGALETVVTVTAVDAVQRLYQRATGGDHVDVAAPGVEILSTTPSNGFGISSGTSLAAAYLSGVAALLLERDPGLAPARLQALVQETARDLGPKGVDRGYGHGLLDACRAFERLDAPTADRCR